MKETPKDTIICHYVGRCKNHPIKDTAIIDTSITVDCGVDTSFAQSNRESFQAVIKGSYENPKPENVLTAFDTIKPCDVSLFTIGTYYVPKSIPVRKTAEMETPMNYDILANGVVFTFMLLLSAKYIITCIPAWKALISDLKHIA
jgi:hypothetical protein